jgi:hypothetical protein
LQSNSADAEYKIAGSVHVEVPVEMRAGTKVIAITEAVAVVMVAGEVSNLRGKTATTVSRNMGSVLRSRA